MRAIKLQCALLLYGTSVFVAGPVLFAQEKAPETEPTVDSPAKQLPVLLYGRKVFEVRTGYGDNSAEERVLLIEARLRKVDIATFEPVGLNLRSASEADTLYYNDQMLLRVTDVDASLAGVTRGELVRALQMNIVNSLGQLRSESERTAFSVQYARLKQEIADRLSTPASQDLIKNTGMIVLMVGSLIFVLWLIATIYRRIYAAIDANASRPYKPLRIGGRTLLGANTFHKTVRLAARSTHFVAVLAAVLIAANFVLGLFPDQGEWSAKAYARGSLYTIIWTVLVAALFRWVARLTAFVQVRSAAIVSNLDETWRMANLAILSLDQTLAIVRGAINLCRITVTVALGYAYLAIVFSLFAFTRDWADLLLSNTLGPLSKGFNAFVAYLPDAFIVLLIIFGVRYLLRFMHSVFREVEKGRLEISGFYREWAMPTHRLMSFLLAAFAVVMAFPYLPGSDSEAFKGVSIFLGLMLSLGSSAIIGNIIAGVVVTYMRPFKIGDRVKIGDTVGDVIEKSLLVTRIRTIKNVDITIPNGMVLGSHLFNYSSAASESDSGLILHTSVTIGYDVPWRQVHQLLLRAASETDGLRTNPAPFVLQTSLDDYYVSYELNAYTDHPSRMALTYSALHQRIQDVFHGAGVEIMSPHYYALRDGNSANIPKEYLPEDYDAAAFRVETETRSRPNVSDQTDRGA